MIRVATLLALLLLAQSTDDGRSRTTAPDPRGVHVDRHVDAHVAPREAPSASPSEQPRRESPPPPAAGTDVMQSPPAIQLYRDPLSRDRRY